MTGRRWGATGDDARMSAGSMVVAADAGGVHTGVVSAFDEAAGLGRVVTGSGHELDFHCTAIADGTRVIDVGATVAFTVATGHLGVVEARSMVTVDSPATVDGGRIADPAG